jgi:MshEN domain
MAEEKMRLGEFLVSRKIITTDQLNRALLHQQQWEGRLGEALVFLRILSEDKLLAALKYHLEIPIIDIDELKISSQIIKLIPKKMAEKYKAVPIRITLSFGKKTLLTAMSDPLDLSAIEELQFAAGYKIQPVLSRERSIKSALGQYYNVEMGYIDTKTKVEKTEIVSTNGNDDNADIMTIIRGGDELTISSSGEVLYDDGERIMPTNISDDSEIPARDIVPEDENMREIKKENKLLRALVKVLIEKEYITIEDIREKLED